MTSTGSSMFVRNLTSGIDAVLAEGASVALLEVACMRPQDVGDAGVRALPERGDEAIACDLGYRWDGVHVYKPGANLVYTAVAPDLLRLAGV